LWTRLVHKTIVTLQDIMPHAVDDDWTNGWHVAPRHFSDRHRPGDLVAQKLKSLAVQYELATDGDAPVHLYVR